MQTLLIDNYDSYTYIIAQYIWKINGIKPIIIKNNSHSLEEVKKLKFDNIVISPGPGTPHDPKDVALSLRVFGAFPNTPILGVCLGHQCLGFHFGADVKKAPVEMHGKYSDIVLNSSALFRDMPSTIKVVRYHSLIVDKQSLPEELEITSETLDEDKLIMALQHRDKPFYGLQFHPESVGTEYGEQIFRNFKDISEQWIEQLRAKKPTRRLFIDKLEWIEPEHVFETCFKNKSYAFWLDSSLIGYNGRFSFMGVPSYIVEKDEKAVKVKPSDFLPETDESDNIDFFNLLQEKLNNVEIENTDLYIPFKGGFVGYLNYEMEADLGVILENKKTAYPTSMMMWVEKFVAYDLASHSFYLCSICQDQLETEAWFDSIKKAIAISNSFEKLKFVHNAERAIVQKLSLSASKTKSEYIEDIHKIMEYLKLGETYETCLTNEFEVRVELDSYELYKVLRLTNPAPYSAYIKMPGTTILSSSPECFITLDNEGKIKSEPIKGTRAKGATPEETAVIRESLIQSTKDHSELLMIIDLIRNDLSICCEKASVKVTEFMKVSEYATVLQLSSVIEGKLAADVSGIQVMKAIFPGGSITGAPKFRTMQIIDQLEQRTRGVYTGSIGYFSVDKSADFNIAIRTLVHNTINDTITFGSGGAIISESDPEEEYREILVKAYALLRAVYLAKYREFENYRIESVEESIGDLSRLTQKYAQKYLSKSPDLESIFEAKATSLI